MIKNTYITYNKLSEIVNEYFEMNGGEDVMGQGEQSHYINLAIQDLLNESSYSYRAEFDSLKREPDLYKGEYSVFHVEFPIERIHELFIDGAGENMVSQLVSTMPYIESQQFYFRRGTNIVYAYKDIESITINYEASYVINNMTTKEERNREVPIPFNQIPELVKRIYDWSSTFTFFQGEGAYTDFYGHAVTRAKNRVKADELSSEQTVTFNEFSSEQTVTFNEF